MAELTPSNRGQPEAENDVRPFVEGDRVHVVTGVYNGQRGYVAKIAAKVKVQLDSGNLVDLYKTSVKLNVADVEAAQVGCPGPQAPANPLIQGADVEIIGGNYKGSRGRVAKLTGQKVDVILSNGEKVCLMQSNVRPLSEEPQACPAVSSTDRMADSRAASSPLMAATDVEIVGGNYKGRRGRVVKVTGQKVEVILDNREKVSLMQSNVRPLGDTPEAAAQLSLAKGQGGQSQSAMTYVRLLPKSRVRVTGGCHSGASGTVVSITEKMVRVALDGSDRTVCVQQTSVVSTEQNKAGASISAFKRLSGHTGSSLPSDGAGEASLDQLPIKKIVLQAPHEKEDDCFIKYYAIGRVLQVELPVPSSTRSPPVGKPTHTHEGREYHLLSSKVVDDGYEFWGGKKQMLRMMYVTEGERGLQDELERLADFAAIPLARKIASRLELLQSPGLVYQSSAEFFEMIEEPQPSKESGGCGFIPQELLYDLVAGRQLSGLISSIQVRIVGPRLGVLKGMLTLRRNIDKIQLPPSMLKVGPSRVCSDELVYVVVTQVFPSSTSRELAKCLLGPEKKAASQTLLKKLRPRLSGMVKRILLSLGVGPNDLSAHEKDRPRQEAFLGGVTDPTFAIPKDQVFIPGLLHHVPVIEGVPCVFVSRCPCIEPKDGKRLRVLVERPSDMSCEDWDALQSRHFGEIIFSNTGHALPETIAAGDLDGDRYYVCWNPVLVSSVTPEEESTAAETGPPPSKPGRPAADPAVWLERAQEHMLKHETIHEGHLIGRLYNAAEKIADESDLGIRDPDARALFEAYTQAIDQGKHGGEIYIPEHLRKRFRL